MEIASLSNFVTWQKSVRLAADVIKLTQRTSLSRHLWARDQLRRAALSIPSNIAGVLKARRLARDPNAFAPQTHPDKPRR
jgi:four helix bundle protein